MTSVTLNSEDVRKGARRCLDVRIDFLLNSDDLERTLMTLSSGLQNIFGSCSSSDVVQFSRSSTSSTSGATLGCDAELRKWVLIY